MEMPPGLDLLTRLRLRVVDRLQTGRELNQAPRIRVLGKDLTELDAQINTMLLGKLGEFGAGLSVVVWCPGLSSVDGKDLVAATVSITVMENLVLNNSTQGCKKPAENIALYCYMRLRGWAPEEWSELRGPKGGSIMQMLNAGPDVDLKIKTRIEYGVTLQATSALEFSEDTN